MTLSKVLLPVINVLYWSIPFQCKNSSEKKALLIYSNKIFFTTDFGKLAGGIEVKSTLAPFKADKDNESFKFLLFVFFKTDSAADLSFMIF